MSTVVLADLLQLPRRKRLEIAERLWLSVADEAKMPLPKEHKRILNRRLADYRSGKSTPIAHAVLMQQVRTP